MSHLNKNRAKIHTFKKGKAAPIGGRFVKAKDYDLVKTNYEVIECEIDEIKAMYASLIDNQYKLNDSYFTGASEAFEMVLAILEDRYLCDDEGDL